MQPPLLKGDDREDRSSRVGFEIIFRIAPANRVEFLQTAMSLLSGPKEERQPCSRSCFERVGVENMFLWRESWSSRAALEERLRSASVEALLGAIEVLGRREEMKILELSDRVKRDGGGA
jgi:quinol monooxygenase YgiN